MSDTAAQVEAIKARISQAQQRRTRAEVQRDHAVAQRDKALADMEAEFGVATLDEARALLQTMQGDVAKLIEDVAATLEGIE